LLVSHRARVEDGVFVVLVLGLWIVPLVVGGLTSVRADAALLPVVLVLRRTSPMLVATLSVASLVVAFYVDVLFFQARVA
jgi:hypothetical protein